MLIKLNDKGVRAYMASGGARYRPKPDWLSRSGRIVKYNRDRSVAYVVWNGNRSFDRVSVDLIEPATQPPDLLGSFLRREVSGDSLVQRTPGSKNPGVGGVGQARFSAETCPR